MKTPIVLSPQSCPQSRRSVTLFRDCTNVVCLTIPYFLNENVPFVAFYATQKEYLGTMWHLQTETFFYNWATCYTSASWFDNVMINHEMSLKVTMFFLFFF